MWIKCLERLQKTWKTFSKEKKKDGTPRISFVIPVYNTAGEIVPTINSLRAQTLKDIEIIVIDDGSTDNLFELINYYMNKDRRIKYRRLTERGGAARARNIGNKLALTSIICVVDAGDTSTRFRAEIVYNFFRKHPKIGIFCCAAMYDIDPWEEPQMPRVYKGKPGERLKFEHPAVAYRRDVAVKYPYREDCIDTDQYGAFFFTLKKKGVQFAVTDEIVITKLTLRNYKYGRDLDKGKMKKIENCREFGIDIPEWLLKFEKNYKRVHGKK